MSHRGTVNVIFCKENVSSLKPFFKLSTYLRRWIPREITYACRTATILIEHLSFPTSQNDHTSRFLRLYLRSLCHSCTGCRLEPLIVESISGHFTTELSLHLIWMLFTIRENPLLKVILLKLFFHVHKAHSNTSSHSDNFTIITKYANLITELCFQCS